MTILVTGNFKSIHSGHVRLLRYAATLGENLVVGMIKDSASGEDLTWRVNALMSLGVVRRVEIFDGDVLALIERLKPSIIVKGLEFAKVYNIEADLLDKIGGKLVFSSGVSLSEDLDVSNFQSSGHLDFSKLNDISNFLTHGVVIKLQSIVDSFRNLRICVIGDVIVDEYINCRILGLSQEEPLPVASPLHTSRFIGGAAVVAAHQASLGASVKLLTILGMDSEAIWINEKITSYGVHLEFMTDPDRPTTLKQRFKRGNQTLFKMSRLSQEGLQIQQKQEFLKMISEAILDVDLVVLSDFSYGVLDKDIVVEIIRLCKSSGKVVCADSQSSSQIGSLGNFSNIDLVSATEFEVRQELRNANDGLAFIAENLRQRMNFSNLILKLGGDGILFHHLDVAHNSIVTQQIPALNRYAIDTSGAGDSLLAIASMCLATKKGTLREAALLGSIGAGIQVSRFGNIPVNIFEIGEELKQMKSLIV